MRGNLVKQQADDIYILPLLVLPPGKFIFPHGSSILVPDKHQSVNAVKYALTRDGSILLLNQVAADKPQTKPEDFYEIGVIARITEHVEKSGSIRLIVQGITRAVVLEFFETDYFLQAKVQIVPENPYKLRTVVSLMKDVTVSFEKYLEARKKIRPTDSISVIPRTEDPSTLADIIADFLAKYTNYQSERLKPILETLDPKERLEKLLKILNEEIELLKVDSQIENKVREQMHKHQKEFYLFEKMKAIQKELGRGGQDPVTECEELRKKVKEAKMSEEAEEKALHEIDRLEQLPPMSAESGVIRTYVDYLISLPWSTRTECKIDINEAERMLNEDHYGLEKPKERILEYLAVLKLTEKLKGPILCFIGPPGVGKTSLGKSIARATNRNFVRMSLGGVRDEAEIRGHRRTYIGSIPGRIIQGIIDSKSKNPLFLLDEVDKMGRDFRGDPASALLEVLDPEQNNTFRDHYLDVAFDLSEVMFITTGNVLQAIPPALRDRMEVIELPGYTEYEKRKIAELFLIPKQLEANGLKKESAVFSEDAIQSIIQEYTREAGVRNLERELSSISRKIAKKIVKEGESEEPIKVTKESIREYLGSPKFSHGNAEEHDEIGVATGLSYTEVGGDIISIEATTMAGEGELKLTGRLGEVMQESAQTALSYIRSKAGELDVPSDFNFDKRDIHIHVPAGAQPKEGPSAGITIATAVISALTAKPVSRDVAMTGEITLRGRVLPIGGLKEKVLAAHRAGIKNIIIPKENEKDLADIPEEVRNSFEFYQVESMDKVLEIALKDSPELKESPNAS
ncbi:TPA: endopeptidase La [Candidatus Poribacteria bacterium]|nr:endopeptidase La [Candidatus Poribacteria bacterium]